jgi:predicted amidohydrolase
VYDIGPARVGLMVCFDWYYPESARTLALKGADIIAHPSNLVLPDCPDSMVTRCLENRVFAVTCNRIGSEERGGKKKLTYIGNSEVVTPKGEILQRAKPDQEELSIIEIDPLQARDKKLNPYNDLLAGRRPDLYSS